MRKRRIKMIKIMVIVFIIVTTLVSVTALSNGDRGKYASFTEVYVKPGDTLWGIASEYYGDSVDLRRAVFAICECTGLDGAEIYFGKKLLVPEL